MTTPASPASCDTCRAALGVTPRQTLIETPEGAEPQRPPQRQPQRHGERGQPLQELFED